MKNENKKIKGIGGWLIVWLIYSSFISLFLLLELLGSGSDTIKIILLLGVGTFGWMIFNFSQKSKSTSKNCADFLWVLIIIGVFRLLPILIEAMGGNYVEGVLLLDYVFFLLGTLIPIGLNVAWIFYFKKSKRVKNTFVE